MIYLFLGHTASTLCYRAIITHVEDGAPPPFSSTSSSIECVRRLEFQANTTDNGPDYGQLKYVAAGKSSTMYVVRAGQIRSALYVVSTNT